MSTTSTIPKPWADGPWPILSSPQADGADIKSHLSVELAVTMVHIHNMFIRSINSLTLQSPYIKSPTDIADLLFYSKTVIKTIHFHHESEEKYLFPGLADYTKNPKLMAVNEAQHASFHDNMNKFAEYCTVTTPATYSYTEYKALLDSFAAPLYRHLVDEIPSILALKSIPSKDLKAIWAETEKHVSDGASMDEMFPFAFGTIDVGFEEGQFRFPPVPKFTSYIVKYYFARKHAGAWRFNPCDLWGKPRELVFLPKGEEVKSKV